MELIGGDLAGRSSVDLAEAVANRGGERIETLLGSELAGHRSHAAGFDATRNDPLERTGVVVDVHGEAMGCDAATDVDTDRADLPTLGSPDARQPVDDLGLYAPVAKGLDDHPFHAPDVLVDVIPVRTQAYDRVAHELARAVVGDAPAAIGIDYVDALPQVPVLTHRELIRSRATALRVDRRVLEQEKHVRNLALLTGALDVLLELARIPVGHHPWANGPNLVHGLSVRGRQPPKLAGVVADVMLMRGRQPPKLAGVVADVIQSVTRRPPVRRLPS